MGSQAPPRKLSAKELGKQSRFAGGAYFGCVGHGLQLVNQPATRIDGISAACGRDCIEGAPLWAACITTPVKHILQAISSKSRGRTCKPLMAA